MRRYCSKEGEADEGWECRGVYLVRGDCEAAAKSSAVTTSPSRLKIPMAAAWEASMPLAHASLSVTTR